MAKTKLTAKKYRLLAEPYSEWTPHPDRRIVLYGIEHKGSVDTISGPMEKVVLKQRVEFISYSQDVAAMVGKLAAHGTAGVLDSMAPELWDWNGCYWLKANDGAGREWYKDQCFLFYKVDVRVSDDYIDRLAMERDLIVKSKQS